MIRIANYEKLNNNQIKVLFSKGFQSLVIFASPENNLYYPSLLKHRFYGQIVWRLQGEKKLKAAQLCWLIISKAALGQNYLVAKARLIQKHGQKWAQIIDKWLSAQQPSSPPVIQKPIQSAKVQMRNHFQTLNQKATKYEYFRMKEVPVYLIATQWLEKFYDTTFDGHIPPIDNSQLVSIMPYIDTDSKFVHLNYELKPQVKQNQHYKIVCPETWQFLYSKFNGVEIKRFTTSEKQPTAEVQYRKLSLSLVQDRYFHVTNLTVLVPRFTKFKSFIERIKRLFIAYKVVPFQSLKKVIQIIKVKGMTDIQIIDLVQDDDIQSLQRDDQRFEKVEIQLDVEEAKIYAVEQQIILNFVDEKDKEIDFFSQINTIQTIITRQSCLQCGNYDEIFLCICKAVHFCSLSCQKNHKQHAKQCQKIRKQQIQLAKLIKDYEITHKQIQLRGQDILQSGKVGLQNLRNTCYLNSALQCILRVQKLVKYFGGNDHVKDLNVQNVLGSQGHLACAFGQLVKKHYTSHKRSISPIDVIRIIAKNPQFRGSDHQDSQQFLNYFLDKIHQDLNRVKNKPYTQEIQSNGRPDQIVSTQSWDSYLKRNQSFIQQLFTGQYKSEIRCPDCERVSITFDPFMSVTLQFPREEKMISIKGYLLSRQGQFLKLESTLPVSTLTELFLARTFNQQVVAVNLKNKLVKKQWREDVPVSKNYSDQGILLFYVKEDNWEKKVNLQFVDENQLLTAFTRRIYIKAPETFQELKREIYSRLKYPVQKVLSQKFTSQEEYISFCQQKNLLLFINPVQNELNFSLEQQLTLKVQFNPQIKFLQKPKLNQSLRSYEPIEQVFSKSHSKELSLHNMLQNFTQPQKLTQDNMWYCCKCKQHKMADKIMKLYKLPQILIFHLKRFNHKSTKYRNMIGVQKIQSSVKLDEKQTINGVQYELIGVVNHYGSMTFGHYTAFVKKDEWMKYDDESCKRANMNGDNAYLLFYKRSQVQE